MKCLCWESQFSSVQSLSCPTLCDSMDWSTPDFPVHHQLRKLKLMSIELVMPSNYLILCRPLLLPSIFPSIRVFSNESVLHIRWPKYWSFSFSISPSSEFSGLFSFRMDWLDLLAIQGLSRAFSSTTVQKYQFFSAQLSLLSNSHIHTRLLEKPYLSGTEILFFHFMPRKECPPPLSFWVCQRSLQPHCF